MPPLKVTGGNLDVGAISIGHLLPGSLQGRVWLDGKPATERTGDLSTRYTGPFHRFVTDAEGRFTLPDLPPGRYQVRMQTALPSYTYIGGLDRVRVASGLTTQHEFRLHQRTVRLTLKDKKTGKPVPRQRLMIHTEDRSLRASLVTDREGAVSFLVGVGLKLVVKRRINETLLQRKVVAGAGVLELELTTP